MSVKPLTVANPSFALEAMARDCPPLQFVREFTMNALEAIDARREIDSGFKRLVVWREFSEALGLLGAPKLCCIDTGMGMSPDDLERYIASLASTSKRQGLDGNYGMGAKIAGAVGNPAGLTYMSWTGGKDAGHTCTLLLDGETGRWGLNESSDSGEVIQLADPDLCPQEIQDAGWRGTVVIFHGRDEAHDTTQPPTSDLGAEWLMKAVNIRFYDLPNDVEIRCQRPGDPHVRRALGQRALLDTVTETRGEVALSDAVVEWRILTDDHERRRKQNHRWAATGHRAALHGGELYDLRQHASGGYRKLQEFGILFGHERVTLYVRPENVQTDTVRAHLVVEGASETKELPWNRWADEFIERMPEALRALVEKAAGQQASRDRRDIIRRLQDIARDLPIPRYQAADDGVEKSDTATHGGPEDRTPTANGSGSQRKDGSAGGNAQGGNVLSLFTRPDGAPASPSDSNRIPEIRPYWIEPGHRPDGVLEDLAATFLPRQGVVQLNAEFRGYTALLGYCRRRHTRVPGSEPVVLAEVRAACEDLVIEFIVGVLRLRCQPHWTAEATDHALDDRALTACLMQHATLVARIDERLNRRLRRAA